MVRSLYAGISGLRSHQVALDVTGNNIANVNTVGFKAGRATFKESMAQMLQGPSRPAGNQSGTNPLQIGLGTSIGSIDTMLRQGNMQTTGQITDLAIEGRAYFAFSSGNGVFYSRNGGLHLDADGYLVSPTTGWRLQGKMADTFGNYNSGSTIGDLRIPWGEKAPAQATTYVEFGCNLNSDSQELGTVTHTNSFLRSAAMDTGRALNERLDTSIFTFESDSMQQAVLGDTFVAVKELERLENDVSKAYSDIDRYYSEIQLKRDEIIEIDNALVELGIRRIAIEATPFDGGGTGPADPWYDDPVLNNEYVTLLAEIDSKNTQKTNAEDRISLLLDGDTGATPADSLDGINTLLAAGGIIEDMQADIIQLRHIVAQQKAEHIDSIASRTLLTSLFDEGGNSLGIKGGDVITFETGDSNIPAFKFTVLRESEVLPEGDINYPHVNYPLVGRTLEDFRKAMEGYLNALHSCDFSGNLTSKQKTDVMNNAVINYVKAMDSDPTHLDYRYDIDNTNTPPTYEEKQIITIDYDSDGSFQITNNTADFTIPYFGVGSSRPTSNGYVSNLFSFDNPIESINSTKTIQIPNAANPTGPLTSVTIADMAKRAKGVTNSEAVFIPASADDRLADVYDAKAQSLHFKNGDVININGTVGVRGKAGTLEYTDELTLQDLLTEMQNVYNLPPTDGTIYQRPSISIKQAGDGLDETVPLGSIVLRGTPGSAFKLEGLSVTAKDSNVNDPPPPTAFAMNMSFEYIQDARDAQDRKFEGVVYDESGEQHHMKVTFIPLQQPGEWLWEIALTGEQRIIGGNSGKITFVDGTPSSVTYDDNSNSFRFDPMNGSSQVDIKLEFGAPKSKAGVTQYASTTTTEFKYQDGYPMGKLEEIFVDEKGEISGKYTNAVVKAIGMVYLAEFNNPAGLLKTGNSMYSVSPNSGQAVMHQPQVGTPSRIKPGALEMSNVELETEFTNMITIQRGYQANARVITTSDSMLQELVQLVR